MPHYWDDLENLDIDTDSTADDYCYRKKDEEDDEEVEDPQIEEEPPFYKQICI